MGDTTTMATSPALASLRSAWQAQGWPLTDLAAFRMEDAGSEPLAPGTEPAVPPAVEPPPVDLEAELERWKAEARKHEDRAKSNASAKRELEQLRLAAMSDQEKAVAAAKAEGRAEALIETGTRLVRAEMRAAAAGRLDTEQLATLVDGINVAAFLTDDGDVDTDKVAKWIDGVIPAREDAGGSPFPDLGQGARGGHTPLNGDPLTRDLKNALGIR